MTLRQYLDDDPDDLGFAPMIAEGNHQGIAEAINAKTISNGLSITRDVLEVFLLGQGIAAIAELTGGNSATPTPLRVACISLGKMLASREFPSLILDDPATVAMRGALVAGGVMTQAQDDALMALGVRIYYSHGDLHKLGVVHHLDVAVALSEES